MVPFSAPSGELVGFNDPNPTTHDPVPRYEPLYEERWDVFLMDDQSDFSDERASMHSDVRILTKILLGNDDIEEPASEFLFNDPRRDGRVISYYDAQEEFWNYWLDMFQLRLSIYADNEIEDNLSTLLKRDSGFFERPYSLIEGLEIEIPRPLSICNRIHSARLSGVPQNVGWRFSDDIEPMYHSIDWHLSNKTELVARSDIVMSQLKRDTPRAVDDVSRDEDGSQRSEMMSINDSSIYPVSYGAFDSQLLAATSIPLPPSRSNSTSSLEPDLPPTPVNRDELSSYVEDEVASQSGVVLDIDSHRGSTEDYADDKRWSGAMSLASNRSPPEEHNMEEITPATKRLSVRSWFKRAFGGKRLVIRHTVIDGKTGKRRISWRF